MAVSPSKRFLLVAFLLLCFLSINATAFSSFDDDVSTSAGTRLHHRFRWLRDSGEQHSNNLLIPTNKGKQNEGEYYVLEKKDLVTVCDENLGERKSIGTAKGVVAAAQRQDGEEILHVLNARLPAGRIHHDSQRLHDQTSAARLVAEPLDFSGIHNLTEILHVATSD
ncbi:hypothetical protein JHK85_011293 [Glycine max]|nr:hypothetical protein JHK85_011293 [Glycine max]KAG5067250.1 hypothetical protein JHK86_010981 [Glycine max]